MNPLANVTRAMRRQLERDNAKLPTVLQPVPRATWPINQDANLIEVWRSRGFLVQIFLERLGLERLSVSRAAVNDEGRWVDGVTWDELQQLKRECGRGSFDAVEVYPKDRDIVNVANLRHLWVFTEPSPFLSFVWRVR
jgi:hypothetical protein